ncbi:MAG: sulfotransferase [Pseudomonadota bacterium]
MADFEPTLLFGVGAQKSGTSWLYDYLSAHPDCHLRRIKELGFFSRSTERQARQVVERFETKLVRTRRKKTGFNLAERRKLRERIRDLEEWLGVLRDGSDAAYLDYLNKGRSARRLVADITPEYALASPAVLTRMAALSEQTRFVFIMRDPVARLWSAIRMAGLRRGGPEPDDQAAFAGNLLAEHAAEGVSNLDRRSDYADALEKLTAIVPAERRLFLFYEELFCDPTVRTLCDFLSIEFRSGDYSRRVHEGLKLSLEPEEAARLRTRLAPQYAAAERVMGRLPEAWMR